jgi:DNA polymerase III subunit beta
MEFAVNREILLPALGRVVGIVERRQTLPVLSNLLFVAQGHRLTITGSDLEVEVKTDCGADVIEEGAITIPARKLADICRNLEDAADIRFRAKEERCVVTSGRGRFSLGVLPAVDFPQMEIDGVGRDFSIQEGVLKRLFEKTGFAMAQQDVRYYLNGLLMEFRGSALSAVATDGHRLAKYQIEGVLVDGENSQQVIVPNKTVLELRRQLAHSEEAVSVRLSDKNIRIALDRMTVTSKLVDGRYPEYERVIPKDVANETTVKKEELKRALSRTAILSNEKYRGVRLIFEPGVLKLLAHNPEQEEAEEEIPLEYDGEAVSIGFNVTYLVDVLSAIDGDEVSVQFNDANSSSVWRGRGADAETYVVMPMRL